MSGYLAKVRLPLTIDERLDILAILERTHGPVAWRVLPNPGAGGKWFVVERRRS